MADRLTEHLPRRYGSPVGLSFVARCGAPFDSVSDSKAVPTLERPNLRGCECHLLADCRRMRARARAAELPIVAVSGEVSRATDLL